VTELVPYGAVIVIATLMYAALTRPHNVPRMNYLWPARQTPDVDTPDELASGPEDQAEGDA
jgi:hypothetical protein